MSKLLIIVGCPGAGKTYLAKQLIKPVHTGAAYIFDVNNEYGDTYRQWFTELDGDFNEFVTHIRRVKKAVILFEDATGYLPVNGRNVPLVKAIQARRHTGNTFIILFHSMRDVPKYIARFANAIYIFKTLDNPKFVRNEFDEVVSNQGTLYQTWSRVYEAAQGHKFFSSSPPPKGVTPPMEVFSQY